MLLRKKIQVHFLSFFSYSIMASQFGKGERRGRRTVLWFSLPTLSELDKKKFTKSHTEQLSLNAIPTSKKQARPTQF